MCFLWAGIGIVSRVAMAIMGEQWAVWEESQAYKEERPAWVLVVSVVGYLLVALTWMVYLTQSIPYGWVLALMMTSTAVKISILLFNYSAFRVFMKESLRDKKRMMVINASVVVLSAVLIWMGVFLYR